MLVVALDPPCCIDRKDREEVDFLRIVEETKVYVSAYKVGLPLILERGLEVIPQIKEKSGRRVIADFKLADIGDIMVTTLKILSNFEVDSIIAHGFIGIEGGLDKLVEEAQTLGVDVIIVASMSHRGSIKYLDKHYIDIVLDALKVGAHGIVLPATRPDTIKRAREIVGNALKIYSPGIGIQGAMPGEAICAGADFEIVGRLITMSSSPGRRALEISQAQMERVKLCRGSS